MSFSPNVSPLHHSAVEPSPSTVSATATTVFQRPSDDTNSSLLKRKRSVEPETAQELPSLAQGNITMGALAKDAASATGLVDAKVPQGSKDESGPPSQSNAGLFNQENVAWMSSAATPTVNASNLVVKTALFPSPNSISTTTFNPSLSSGLISIDEPPAARMDNTNQQQQMTDKPSITEVKLLSSSSSSTTFPPGPAARDDSSFSAPESSPFGMKRETSVDDGDAGKKKKNPSKKGKGQFAGMGKAWRLGTGVGGANEKTASGSASAGQPASFSSGTAAVKSRSPSVAPSPASSATYHSPALSSTSALPAQKKSQKKKMVLVSSPPPEATASPSPAPEPLEREDSYEGVYCMCKQKYDEDQLMLACDTCQEWYHPRCVGIDDIKVELVDAFVCPRCPNTRTTWKTKCRSNRCFRPAIPPLTKYCSTACGIAFATRIIKKRSLAPDQILSQGQTAHRPKGVVQLSSSFPLSSGTAAALSSQHPSSSLSPAFIKLTLDLAAARETIAGLDHSLALLDKRQILLHLAVARAEKLSAAIAATTKAESPAVPVKKGKSKVSAGGGAADGVCGFDTRLVMDDVEWEGWTGSEVGRLVLEGGEVAYEGRAGTLSGGGDGGGQWCGEIKKRCQDHSGWPRVRQLDFKLEQEELRTRREMLISCAAVLENRIKLEQERQEATDRVLTRQETASETTKTGEANGDGHRAEAAANCN